jgi:hypothetical protein
MTYACLFACPREPMHCVQLMIYDPLMLAITLFVYFMLLSYSIALLVSMHRFMQFVCLLYVTQLLHCFVSFNASFHAICLWPL